MQDGGSLLVFGEAGVQTQSVKANPAEIEEPLPPAESEGGDVAPGEGSLTPAPAAPAPAGNGG
jgi:hypothetical protein